MSLELSEDSIIEKVISGEKEAYRYLVEKYKDLSYSLALKIVKDPMQAEEVAQEAFIKAYRSLKMFNKKSKFSTWLFRIVYTTAISLLRKEKKYVSYDDTVNTEPMEDENNSLEQNDRKVLLENALATLGPEDSTAVTLYYLHQYSMDEVAETMGLKISTVKVKIHRARKKLASELRKVLNEEVVNL